MTYVPEALRKQVALRANERCEYCRLYQDHSFFTHEIDHIYAEKHGGETIEANLCFACADCNRHKGSDICSLDTVSGEIIALFHPRRAQWMEHFQMEESGIIRALTPTGRVTARLIGFNRQELVTERARLLALGVY